MRQYLLLVIEPPARTNARASRVPGRRERRQPRRSPGRSRASRARRREPPRSRAPRTAATGDSPAHRTPASPPRDRDLGGKRAQQVRKALSKPPAAKSRSTNCPQRSADTSGSAPARVRRPRTGPRARHHAGRPRHRRARVDALVTDAEDRLAGQDLPPLLHPRVHVHGHAVSGRPEVVELEQLAVRVRARPPKDDLLPAYGMDEPVSRPRHPLTPPAAIAPAAPALAAVRPPRVGRTAQAPGAPG